MVWAAALRGIARDIQEIALLFALRTSHGGCLGRNEESALGAFPIGQMALGADISLKLAPVSEAAVGANPLFLSFFHLSHLLSGHWSHEQPLQWS